MRRRNEEDSKSPPYSSRYVFNFGAATVGKRSHSERVLEKLQIRSKASQRVLDPDAGYSTGIPFRVHRSPSLAALKFSVLPAITSDAQAPMTHQTTVDTFPNHNSTGGIARVLIVDDEPCISDLLSEMLELLGYAPTKCCSPSIALALLEKEGFDVVLSDFRMPQMNGDEFFRRAVARNEGLRSRFVFLTGDSVSEQTHSFLTEQGSRHLCKPFDIASVNQIIADVISEHGAPVAS